MLRCSKIEAIAVGYCSPIGFNLTTSQCSALRILPSITHYPKGTSVSPLIIVQNLPALSEAIIFSMPTIASNHYVILFRIIFPLIVDVDPLAFYSLCSSHLFPMAAMVSIETRSRSCKFALKGPFHLLAYCLRCIVVDFAWVQREAGALADRF